MNKEEIRKRRQREYARKYYEEHKEELRKKKNDYRKNNLDKYKKNQKKYYQKNKDYYKNYSKEWAKQKQHELLDEIETLKQELQRKDNIINEVKDIINRMIYMGYCAKTGKGTTATNFMAVGEQSEFGTRAKYILDKIKELEENKYE